MRADNEGRERETLLQEINNAFFQWPELERGIFSQAHYHGKSLEAISRSLQLDVEEVSTILKRCQRRLYASLRNFRKGGGEAASLLPAGLVCNLECGSELPHCP